MKLLIVAAGRLREAWVRAGCDEYARRISRHLPLEIVEVRDAAAVAGRLPERARVIVLDERGRQLTSRDLADLLARSMNAGAQCLAFAIGDADGLPDEVKARADDTVGLSRLTLPHRLARLVLVEQVYRALSIVRGEPYHRD